jgi:two-component system, CitB family, response regulator DctR
MTAIATQTSASEVPARSWRVMIVEDNRAVAALHRRIVDSTAYLKTSHVALNGDHAFSALGTVQPDLVILDLTMSGGDGLSFLRRLRAAELAVDVIVVTASRDRSAVDQVTRLGVVDYLVKPFTPQRLRQSLSAFAIRRHTLTTRSKLCQADVDAVRASGAPRRGRRLPKGLKEATLRAVLAQLDGGAESLSADEVGARVGVARVTARRYLEYLALLGIIEVTRETSGPGRPRNRYRRRAPAARPR